jgi:hypothetical protein
MCWPRAFARLRPSAVRVWDKVALQVRQPAEDGNHQPPGAGGGVRPRFGQRTELPARIHNALDA